MACRNGSQDRSNGCTCACAVRLLRPRWYEVLRCPRRRCAVPRETRRPWYRDALLPRCPAHVQESGTATHTATHTTGGATFRIGLIARAAPYVPATSACAQRLGPSTSCLPLPHSPACAGFLRLSVALNGLPSSAQLGVSLPWATGHVRGCVDAHSGGRRGACTHGTLPSDVDL